jgi:hypothetical protein
MILGLALVLIAGILPGVVAWGASVIRVRRCCWLPGPRRAPGAMLETSTGTPGRYTPNRASALREMARSMRQNGTRSRRARAASQP